MQRTPKNGTPGPGPITTPNTLVQFCEDKLAAVCHHTVFAPRMEEILGVYRDLVSSWGTRRIDQRPPWSGVACDLTPFEISVAANAAGECELRFLVEPQAEPPCPATYWAATRSLFDIVERKWGADLARLRLLEDLLEPTIGTDAEDEGAWTCYGAVFRGQQRSFKLWFSPDCKGVAETGAVCREVMRRLGLGAAWDWTSERLPETASLLFGLELRNGPDARVKLYVRVRDPDFEKLEGVASLAERYVPGDLARFWASLGWSRFPIMRTHAVSLHFLAVHRAP